MKKKFISACEKLNNSLTNHKVVWSVLIGIVISMPCLFRTAYYYTDNNLISLVVNQYYGADNYCIFLNWFLCKLILVIDRMFPYADGYVVICHSFLFVASFWLIYLTFSKTQSIFKRFILIMLLLIAVNGYVETDISNQNFTIQAAGITLTGIISIWCGFNSKRKLPYVIMGTVGITLGAMVRVEACLLTMPYFVLHIIFDVICKKDKGKIKDAVVLTILPVMCMVAVFATNYMVNNGIYKDAVAFNHYRGVVIDYPVKSLDSIQDELPEISENDYNAIRQHLYGDTDRMNIDFMRKVSSISRGKTVGMDIPIDALVNFIYADFLLTPIVLAFALFLIHMKIKRERILEILLIVIGSWIISLYFSSIGRMLGRLWIVLLLAGLAELSMIFLCEKNAFQLKIRRNRTMKIAMAVICMGVVGLSAIMFVNSKTGFSPAILARTGADESEFEKLYVDDSLYVWDERTINKDGYGYFYKQGKLETRNFIDHNIPHGDWIYGQKFMEEYYDRIGTHNPVRALLNRENTYYVARDKTAMETYLQENVNPNAYAVQVDTIKGIPIWKFEVGE